MYSRPVSDKRRQKRKKPRDEEEEAAARYEKQPRAALGTEQQVKALLPIKTKEKGVIPRSIHMDSEEGTNLKIRYVVPLLTRGYPVCLEAMATLNRDNL